MLASISAIAVSSSTAPTTFSLLPSPGLNVVTYDDVADDLGGWDCRGRECWRGFWLGVVSIYEGWGDGLPHGFPNSVTMSHCSRNCCINESLLCVQSWGYDWSLSGITRILARIFGDGWMDSRAILCQRSDIQIERKTGGIMKYIKQNSKDFKIGFAVTSPSN